MGAPVEPRPLRLDLSETAPEELAVEEAEGELSEWSEADLAMVV